MKTATVMVLALLGCGGGGEGDDGAALGAVELDESADALGNGLKVRATESREKPRWKRRFKTDEVSTLYFAAGDVEGKGHQVAFEIFEPQGSVYQRSEATSDGARWVFSSMPVAGTWVQQFGMTGRWKVKVFVDGAAAPAGTLSFHLR